MQSLKILMVIVIFLQCNSCNWFQPTASFIISNKSDDKKVTDIRVFIGDEIVFNDSIRYSNIEPDLQYTPYLTLPKGIYTIKVVADSGNVYAEQPINLEDNRWIFITYNYKRPMDSAEAEVILKNVIYDTSWVNFKRRGSPPGISIFVMKKEPTHM